MKEGEKTTNKNGKTTLLVVVLVALFVIAGACAAIVGHKAYLEKQEARIVNYSRAEGAPLRMRNNGVLVYRYDGQTVLRLSDILTPSKGATVSVLRQVTADGVVVPKAETVDLTATPRLFVFLRVNNAESGKRTEYVLEITSEADYRPDEEIPPFITEDGPILQ